MTSQATPATFDWCQTSWSTEKFVLVSSWWRLSYRYHIDHLEHSYLQMIMKKLFYTGLLSCQSLADSLAFIQIVAFVKIRRWVFYFSIVPWTSKHCHIHEVNNFRCGIADYAGDIWLMPDQLIYRDVCAGEFLVTPVIPLPYRPFRTLLQKCGDRP